MTETRREFFDRIADQWDGWVDLDRMGRSLREGLVELGVSPSSSVVDLGCGTGNLTLALLEHLDAGATITAVDFSQPMLERARKKVGADRVHWVLADVLDLPLPSASVDHVICFSAWPHFPDQDGAIAQVCRILRPGGVVTVWHDISRASVNAIHAKASPAVCVDLLAPVSELAQRFRAAGFAPGLQVDNEEKYLLQAKLSGA